MQSSRIFACSVFMAGMLTCIASCSSGPQEVAMGRLETRRLPTTPDAIAPDGSEVRVLARLSSGGMAHFQLEPGAVSKAVAHRTVEEMWYFLSGRGEMWRKLGEQEEIVAVEAGVAITLPVGTHFQFRSLGDEPLAAVGATMPPWPGDDEAYVVPGAWEPTKDATEQP